MSLVSDFKQRLFRQRTERDTAEERPAGSRPPHLDAAQHLTILFRADSAEDRRAVDKWRDANARSGRKIRVLGYFDQEVGSASFDFSVVTVRHLNWYGLPRGEVVTEFQREPTDILLRLGPPRHPVLDYLAAVRPAKLKVGPYRPDTLPFYHLLFDSQGQERPARQLPLIQHIFTYTNAS